MSSPTSASAKIAPTQAHKKDVYLQLRDRIIQWHYPPGFHLSEKGLSDEFQISRVPIREALRALTADGFVVKKPNQGCYVKQLNVDEAKELFDMRVGLERHVVEQLSQMELGEKWAEDASASWQAMLKNQSVRMDITDFVNADDQFHLMLAKSYGNQSILGIVEDVTTRLHFTKLAVEVTEERIKETAKEHLAIIQAISDKDANAARDAVRENIKHSANRVEIAISRALMAAHAMQ